jgi:hypothetical protein
MIFGDDIKIVPLNELTQIQFYIRYYVQIVINIDSYAALCGITGETCGAPTWFSP